MSTEMLIEGRNAVLEALRSGRSLDKICFQKGLKDSGFAAILKEAEKASVEVRYLPKERLDEMSETGKHQGVIAKSAAYDYSTVDEMLARAGEKGEAPFLILLDGIEDPHNLGAIIRTANLCGAQGVIIPKNRAVGLSPK